jgi:pimeloyl-ACP methyl ester carboxylesterase
LIHGYASAGNWSAAFKNVLATARQTVYPDNFVVQIKYGVDVVPGYAANWLGFPVYQNTLWPLADCAAMADQQFLAARANLQGDWAITRPDVVGHSQGGVITRMLCTQNANGAVNNPFRNADNFYRGRFHRVITIGSPHNGSRLLHYMLAMVGGGNTSYLPADRFYSPLLGSLCSYAMCWAQIAQAKFDPWGPQIQDINDPSPGGNWYPDSAARFHLIRAVIDGGKSPNANDPTLGYQVLDLAWAPGSLQVIPRGSDGVVDYDSMLANAYPTNLAPNVYDMPPTLDISHAEPLWLFGATVNETASPDIAQHVLDALDQNGQEPAVNTLFDSFPLPPRLDPAIKTNIDLYARTGSGAPPPQGGILPTPKERPTPKDGSSNSYSFYLNFPSNQPPAQDINWFALVFTTNGMTDYGVSCQAQGTNEDQVTVTVPDGLVGDVVLYASYLDQSNQFVPFQGQLVYSQGPSGATMTGIGLLPYNPVLPVGADVPILVAALYSDGSSCLRYIAPGTLAAVSSNPSVVSVNDPLDWQLLAVGTAQVVVTWSGFTATNDVTVATPASELPTLSVTAQNSNLTLGWPLWASGFTLESCTNLASPAWMPVEGQPETNDQALNLTLPISPTTTFFRLQR